MLLSTVESGCSYVMPCLLFALAIGVALRFLPVRQLSPRLYFAGLLTGLNLLAHCLGAFINLSVMMANDGRMPVLWYPSDPVPTWDQWHYTMTPDTKLKPLADIMIIPPWWPFGQGNLVSAGDLLYYPANFLAWPSVLLLVAAGMVDLVIGWRRRKMSRGVQ